MATPPPGMTVVFDNLLSGEVCQFTGNPPFQPWSCFSRSFGILAAPFSVPEGNDVIFTRADVAVTIETGTNSFVMELKDDNNGEPGTTLATAEFNDVLEGIEFGVQRTPIMWDPIEDVTLTKDAQYWLTLSTPFADTRARWHINFSFEDVGTTARFFSGRWNVSENSNRPAFRIVGMPIPAP